MDRLSDLDRMLWDLCWLRESSDRRRVGWLREPPQTIRPVFCEVLIEWDDVDSSPEGAVEARRC